MSQLTYDSGSETYNFQCPHCHLFCQVSQQEINCKIFRHGIYKRDFSFLDPHASKEVCDRVKSENLIWGCAKPFRFDGQTVMPCAYV